MSCNLAWVALRPASLGVWAAAGNLFPMQASMQHNSAARWLPREADTPRFGDGLLGEETRY